MGHSVLKDEIKVVNNSANIVFEKKLKNEKRESETTFNPFSSLFPSPNTI